MKVIRYDIHQGVLQQQNHLKKIIIAGVAVLSILAVTAIPALAAPIPGAQVKNPNANSNACWGQDRAYYASGEDGNAFKDAEGNMDIKRSFPPTLGGVGEQRAAWVATYCNPHGPTQ